MKKLASDIENGIFDNIYLFFGDEGYLKNLYADMLLKKLATFGPADMNTDVFEDKSDVMAIQSAILTLPFMGKYRAVVVKNSGLFDRGRKNDSDYMLDSIKAVPKSSILLFVESSVDKRSALYKQVAKLGRVMEFKTPNESDLVKWAARTFKENAVKISAADVSYFISVVEKDMSLIKNEAEKLISYGGGEITKADIDEICVKSLEARVFALVDAIGERKPELAFTLYERLMFLREPPVMILSLLARQFRIILQLKQIPELSAAEAASEMGVTPYAVSAGRRQGRNFTEEELRTALFDCLDVDLAIKTGRIQDKTALETLIAKYAS